MIRTPVVLIQGVWLHRSSWDAWAERFASHGFTVHVPGWPGEAATATAARRDPGAQRALGLDALIEHYEEIARSSAVPPVLIGHSVGGLIAERLLGAGLARAAVAISSLPSDGTAPAATRGRLRPPVQAGPGVKDDCVLLTQDEFLRVFANKARDQDAARLFHQHVVPASRRLLSDLGLDDVARTRPAGIGTGPINAARGPLLLVSGQEDLVAPDAATRSAYKRYGDCAAVSDLKQFADRGHSLTIDDGWREIADYVLTWLAENGIGPAVTAG